MDDFGNLIDSVSWQMYCRWIVSTSTYGGDTSNCYYSWVDV